MQKIAINKKTVHNENGIQNLYYISAISLRNSENKVHLLVPHPNGNDVIEYGSLEEAAAAITKAGFEYELPAGEELSEHIILDSINLENNALDKLLLTKFKSKVNDINPSVAASAIKSLAILNTESGLDVFINKLGEDNEKIRAAAIEGIVNYKGNVLDKLIEALSDTNWVTRNSAITCMIKISETANYEPEKLLIPIINRFDDDNTIVQANALLAAGQIYNNLILKKIYNKN